VRDQVWKPIQNNGKNYGVVYFNLYILQSGSRGRSVSIVSGYTLEDQAIEVRSPARAKDFSSNLCIQTGTGVHPVSYTMGTGVLSQGVRRGLGVTLTTHPLTTHVNMRTTDLVGINGITRVLLVYTCQQGVYPRGHVLPLRLPLLLLLLLHCY
jgi:hypothetical protein